MKVSLVSDLHLECEDLVLPGGELLILAGDVCEARHVKKDMLNMFDRFFQQECAKYEQVLYVLGNHEYYNEKYSKVRPHLESLLPPNVKILNDETFEHKGVLFVGSTMWTDLNKRDPLTAHAVRSMMNDFHCITWDYGGYRKFRPEDTVKMHDKSRQYINTIAQLNRDKRIVVITHHAPSQLSIAPQFKYDTLMNGAFMSDLSDIILDNENISHWVHGHTHTAFDYTISQCRVICNPRGYLPYESTGFDINFTFEVAA